MGASPMWLVKILLILAGCSPIFAGEDAPSETGVVGFLEQFGYLAPTPPNAAASRSEESLSKAISALQSFAGLKVTGIEDKETLRLIKSPRCGVKDNINTNYQALTASQLQQSPFLPGRPWPRKTITYRVIQYTNQLDPRVVDRTIAAAFDVWANKIPLKFTKVSGQANMEIRFARRWHGDDDAFDGPGHVLAHAFAPDSELDGDVHFDDDENWTIGGGRYGGVDFFQVAVHEIGHALGLAHSNVPTSIMYSYYRPGATVALDISDITNIQTLYGKKDQNPPHYPDWPGPHDDDWYY